MKPSKKIRCIQIKTIIPIIVDGGFSQLNLYGLDTGNLSLRAYLEISCRFVEQIKGVIWLKRDRDLLGVLSLEGSKMIIQGGSLLVHRFSFGLSIGK